MSDIETSARHTTDATPAPSAQSSESTGQRSPLRSALRGTSYEQGRRLTSLQLRDDPDAAEMVSTVNTGIADAFLQNPAGTCAGVDDSADMAFVLQQAQGLRAMIEGSGWSQLRQDEEPDLSALEPIEQALRDFVHAQPPSVRERIRAHEASGPSSSLTEEARQTERYNADMAQQVMDTPAMLTAFRNELGADALGALVDMGSWELRDGASRGIGAYLGQLGVPQEQLAVHEYTLTPLMGVGGGVGTPGPVGLGIGAALNGYRIEYRGSRGAWTVETTCLEISGSGGASGGPNLPIDANVRVEGAPVVQNDILYHPRDSFTGAELVSMGEAGVRAGGVASTTGFVSFVNGVTFEYELPTTGELSSVGTDSLGASGGASGTAAVCTGSEVGERRGPRPIQPVEVAQGAGAWLPFFVTTVGFPTGSSELDESDYGAIADTLRAIVSDRMAPLYEAGAVDFRLEVHGNASGRYQGAEDEFDASLRNHTLSRERANAVRGELQRLLDVNQEVFQMSGQGLPALGHGASWAESELGQEASTSNDARHRTAEVIVWVQVCGG